MADITVDNLSELLEIAHREQKEEQKNASTFLEIIGRSRRETYVSSLLAYVIKKDDALLSKLLQHALKDKMPQDIILPEIACKDVTCEYAMSGGRADIFVTGKFTDGTAFTLTIENKVDSWEHGGQTTVYYNYVTTRYAGAAANAFIYLKPDNSLSTPECGSFTELKYSQLNGMITGGTDRVIDDFKEHIMDNFSKKEILDENTSEILEHFTEYNEIFTAAQKKTNDLQNSLFNEIKKNCKGFKKESTYGSHRLYKSAWYSKKKQQKYYFYAELYFKENDPKFIYVQSTVKVYDKIPDNHIYNFCNNLNEGNYCDNFYVFYSKKIESSERYFSDKWVEDIRGKAVTEMKNALNLTENMFNQFMAYLKDIEENSTEN